MPEHVEEPGARRGADLPIRVLYVLAAVALLWVATRRYVAYSEAVFEEDGIAVGRWLLFVVAALLAGVMGGFAARPPARGAYHWSRAAAIAVVPLILLTLFPVLFGDLHIEFPPSWVEELLVLPFTQTGFAMLAGLGVAVGFPARPD